MTAGTIAMVDGTCGDGDGAVGSNDGDVVNCSSDDSGNDAMDDNGGMTSCRLPKSCCNTSSASLLLLLSCADASHSAIIADMIGDGDGDNGMMASVVE